MKGMRAAIVGTAESWVKTPWSDPDLYIASLNDAYELGIQRADEWWEQHPFDKMVFRKPGQKIVMDRDVPKGHYIRPEGHLDWLKARAKTIPVWLQATPPDDWPPNAHRVPIEALEAKYGAYWASGPAYMLMHLYERGFREIHIYGIHLSTEDEYRHQRPNFEHLIGSLLGPERTLTEKDGLRIYDGKEMRIVLPSESPILRHGWRYAYEPKPQGQPNPYAEEWKEVQDEKAALIKALVHWPKGKDRAPALERLKRLEVIEQDIQMQLGKRQIGGTLAVPVLQGV